jgi:tRNA threonylcarbamoyladenosine biosynthesis protein TsaE
MIEVCTIGVAGTQRVAAALLPLLQAGDVVILTGELGAGKTAFTQGLARAAGVTDPVTSPTFTLLRSYPTASGPDLAHVDVYRLERLGEMADLGLDELLDDGAVAVIEWGERTLAATGPDYLHVTVERVPEAADARRLSVEAVGKGWHSRRPAVAAALRAVDGRTPGDGGGPGTVVSGVALDPRAALEPQAALDPGVALDPPAALDPRAAEVGW